MDVLHYSFSLSACPKCHLLVCKHTSFANLDFRSIEQDKQSIIECNKRDSDISKNHYQRLSSHGMNFYILPPTNTSDNHHSWTTFGTGSIESTNTLEKYSIDHNTLCDNIPFANESIINSSLPSKPAFNQIVRTQSECCQKKFKPRICLTKSYSFSTIYTTPKSNHSLTLSPKIQQNRNQSKRLNLNFSMLFLIVLIISYLLTNTLDIVLLYIYYHTNYLYFTMCTITVLTYDIISWLNNFIDTKNLSVRLLLIPFTLRFYILYELIELMVIKFNQNFIDNIQIIDSSSSSTTTTETNISQATDSSLINHHHSR